MLTYALAFDVEKKSTEVLTSSANSTTPQPTTSQPEDEGVGAKPTKRKSRREKGSQVPAKESKVNGATPSVSTLR